LTLVSLSHRIEMHRRMVASQQEARNIHQEAVLFRAIYEQSPLGIILSQDGTIPVGEEQSVFMINPKSEEITGWSREELAELGWKQITHPDDLSLDVNHLERLMRGETEVYEIDKRFVKPDGSHVWTRIFVTQIHTAQREKPYQLCLIFDISNRKRLELDLIESDRSREILFSNLPGMAYRCSYDDFWTMRFISNGCQAVTGYSTETLLDNRYISYEQIIAPEYRQKVRREWEKVIPFNDPFHAEYEIITSSKERRWVMEAGQAVYDERGDVRFLEGIILDISQRKQYEHQLIHFSEYDQMTQLPNRKALEQDLEKESHLSSSSLRALISFDLHALQVLNALYGFDYCHKVTQSLIDDFKYIRDERHKLYNSNGNSFIFFVKDYRDREELVSFCETVRERIEPTLTRERLFYGLGAVELTEFVARDIPKIERNLLIASEKSRNGFEHSSSICFFDESLVASIEREQAIIEELTQIIAGEGQDRYQLFYQPICNLETEGLCGFEALSRFTSSIYGSITPAEFIPIAERTRLIIPLGDLIVKTAFQFLSLLVEQGHEDIHVAVNISSLQLFDTGFVQRIEELVRSTGIRPQKVVLEITESVFITGYQEVNTIFKQLQDLGFSLAIDDFGTGYSSFSREQELNVHYIKLDQYFTRRLLSIDKERSVLADLISMIHKSGHTVVAEGVEHESQKEYLKRHGCDMAQGFLFSRPIPEKDAFALVSERRCKS
ncbi:MAG: EAL domain-containing protein, partial [Sphaerochaetaceae bacterium]|nr:EAL domain-containing protein [Sphaerochaetaceae bacterium]